MKRYNKSIFLGLLLSLNLTSLLADISGTVYKELPVNKTALNTYGVRDSNEPGVGGVTVKAYDSSGNSITTTTDSNGSYTLNTTSGRYRVEFSNWPSYLKPAPIGNSSHTSVQFVDDGSSNVDFGLLNPSEYIDSANPKTVTTIAVNGSGSGDVNDTDPDKSSANFATITSWDYNATTTDEDQDPIATMYQTGAMWGVAYSKQRDKLFSSAVVRRHTGFGKSGNTIGSIYVTTGIRSVNPTTTRFIDLSSLGINVGDVNRTYTDTNDKAHYLSDNTFDPNYDLDAYRKVGKVGIGDIDLSEDEKTLYVMNLNRKEVIAIDVNNQTLENTYPIHDPGCSNGDYRPWAISTHNNSLFIGVVCSAETSQNPNDLKAYVLKYDNEQQQFNKVLSFDLNFTRENAISGKSATWHPWIADSDNQWHGDVYAQPILGDIEFDETGAMILGFIDRYGFMTGNNNYTNDTSKTDTEEGHAGGDILRACPNSNGTWDIENNGSCGGITTNGSQKSNAGPGGGEYYFSDVAGQNDNEYYGHQETASGGLAVLQGSKEVISAVYDPINADAGGVARFDINGSAKGNKKELYRTQDEGGPGPYFGKSGGIGDIEFISTAAPIEIGNRVWFDENVNGIQDANERGIADINISLYCDVNNNGYVYIASAITDSDGNYLFSNDPKATNSESKKYNLSNLKPNQNCKLVIDKNQTSLNDKVITDANRGNGQNDSKGVLDSNDNSKIVARIDASDIPFAGANNHTFDFGFKPSKVCLGDRVWYDDNYNGIQDDGEEGVANITVKLLDSNGNELNTTTTDSNGNYKFCNLDDGEYSVEFVKDSLPKNAVFTKQNQGNDDTKNSDADVNTGKTKSVTLRAGDDYKDLDAGIFVPACIGDRVWFDKNKDGIQDSNESGIEGIDVHLYDSNNNEVTQDAFGNTISPTKTNSLGDYEFCNLVPGDYYVKVDVPNKYKISPKDKGGDDAKDSDIDSNGKMPLTTLDRDENDTSWDAGLYTETCVGDFVWNDKNANGIQDSNESGIDGVKVYLLDSNGDTIGSDTTKNGGKYQICVSDAGTYKVKFDISTLPAGYKVTKQTTGTSDGSDANETTGVVDNVILQDNQINSDIDMGAYKSVCLGDFVWYDKNRNGIQDSNESGIDGIVAHLLKDGVDTEKTTTTDNGGKYQFCDLKPGKYSVKFDIPSDYVVTSKDAGDDAKDSDIDSDTNVTDEITLSNDNNYSLDAGLYYKPSCLGDLVWKDANANGKFDSNESGIDGINVHLLDSNGDEIASTTTKDGGKYQFCQLQPGKYQVKVDIRDGYVATEQTTKIGENNDSDIDINGTTPTINLPSDTNDTSWDAGVYKPACIGNYVWLDSNLNGIQDDNESGISGVKVELLDINGNPAKDANGNLISSINSDDSGYYHICNLKPGEYVVKFTPNDNKLKFTDKNVGNDDTKDSDVNITTKISDSVILKEGEDNNNTDAGLYESGCVASVAWLDKNRNGKIDDGEERLKDINVTLLDSNGNIAVDGDGNLVESVLTNENGEYKFCNLKPGNYKLRFESDKYTIETQDKREQDVKVESGNSNNPIIAYAPFIDTICLGNFVWYDKNLNGIQDEPQEYGVSNIKVTLIDNSGKVLQSTKTDSAGYYKFCNVEPNRDYKIKFDIPNNYHTTLKDRGNSDVKDSDAKDGVIYLFKPKQNSMNLDVGIYCDCDDYKVHPERHKKLSASALNIFGLASMLLALLALARKED